MCVCVRVCVRARTRWRACSSACWKDSACARAHRRVRIAHARTRAHARSRARTRTHTHTHAHTHAHTHTHTHTRSCTYLGLQKNEPPSGAAFEVTTRLTHRRFDKTLRIRTLPRRQIDDAKTVLKQTSTFDAQSSQQNHNKHLFPIAALLRFFEHRTSADRSRPCQTVFPNADEPAPIQNPCVNGGPANPHSNT